MVKQLDRTFMRAHKKKKIAEVEGHLSLCRKLVVKKPTTLIRLVVFFFF